MSDIQQRGPVDEIFEVASGKLKRIVVDLKRSGEHYYLYCECKQDSEPSEQEVTALNRHWRAVAGEVERDEPGISLCDFIQVMVSRLGVRWLDVTVGVDLPEGYQSMMDFCTAYRSGEVRPSPRGLSEKGSRNEGMRR